MLKRLSSGLSILALAGVLSSCSVVKTTGKIAGKTAGLAGKTAGLAATGVGKVVTLPLSHIDGSKGRYNVGRDSYNYTVRGRRYHVMSNGAARNYRATGMASYYGIEGGRKTATGERYRPYGMTAAHKTLPLGTKVRVTNLSNGKSVVVRINDRGPFSKGRIIDCSKGAAAKLDFIGRGVTRVRVETVR